MRITNDCIKENTLFLEVNGVCRNLSKTLIHFEKCCDDINIRVKILEEKVLKLGSHTTIQYKPFPSVSVVYAYYPSIKVIFKQSFKHSKGSIDTLPYDYVDRSDRKSRVTSFEGVNASYYRERYSSLTKRRELNGWNDDTFKK